MSEPPSQRRRAHGVRKTRMTVPHKHVTGEALYIDDMPEPAGLLHVYLGLSDQGACRICRSTSTRCAPRPASSAC